MTTKAGVGTSHHHNPNVAGREAAGQALEKAGIVKPDFVFMFASISYEKHSLLRAVRETTGGAPLTGCSVEGTSIWFSSRDKEKITTGFDRMARQIKGLTRGKLMFREQEKQEILRRFRQSVSPDVPWASFYTIAEIGSVEEHNDRHLYTSVVLALS